MPSLRATSDPVEILRDLRLFGDLVFHSEVSYFVLKCRRPFGLRNVTVSIGTAISCSRPRSQTACVTAI
jgi:hypothetical protein